MRKLIEYRDPVANEWLKCYFIGYTSQDATVIELVGGGVILLPNGTAQIRDVGVKQ